MRQSPGISIIEVMVTVALIAVGAMAFVSAFQGINRALQSSRMRTIATNLAQEEVEYLKNFSYYTLLVTTSTSVNSNFSPNLTYDNASYPPQSFSYWGNSLTRAVYIQYAAPVSGQIQPLPYTSNDPGLKMITVYVWWNDGTAWHDVQMQNLLENPNIATLNSQISGFVYDASAGNAPLSGAIVSVLGSPQWNTESQTNGAFSLSVAAGSYTVVASSIGFFSASSPLLSAPSGGSVNQNFYLVQMASGSVIANSVYFSSHVLISQIVADTKTVVSDGSSQDIQYVELFNPTTAPVSVASDISGPGCSNSVTPLIQINYYCGNGLSCSSSDLTPIPLCYISSSVFAGGYYLIANTTESFEVDGNNVSPDAYFKNNYYPAYSWNSLPSTEIIQTNHSGAVQIQGPGIIGSGMIDEVGWSNAGNGNKPQYYLGTPIPQKNNSGGGGVQSGNQIVRMSSPCAVIPGLGRAYDTQDNADNFGYDTSGVIGGYFINPAYDSLSSTQTSIAGDPAIGGYASSDDGLSAPAVIAESLLANPFDSTPPAGYCPYANFNLTNIATGTWTVTVASGAYEQTVSSVTITATGQTIPILNFLTVPVSSFVPVGFLPLSSTSVGGYIAGTVTNIQGTPLSGITILGGSGSVLTNSSGFYFLASSTGTAALGTAITVTANPNQQNPLYVSQQASDNVYTGEVTNQNFALSQGGEVTGYATSGLSALPGIVFVASNTETSQAGTTDDTGHFYIANLTTGTYTVTPQLSTGQTSSPAQASVSVTSGNLAVFSASFTISGIMGTFTGTVSAGGNPITTGVIIMASTGTLSYPPPNITGSGAGQIYYTTMSQPDGSYSLLVRGSNSSTSYTYNLLAIYPSVNEGSGAVSVVSQSQSGSVNAGQSQTVNFSGL